MKDGRFVQVGTPADVVGKPADAYVRAFTRDVQRAHVLRADSIMGLAAGPRHEGRTPVDITTQLSGSCAAAACEDPLPVLDAGGRPVGSGRSRPGAHGDGGDELDPSGGDAGADEPVLSAAELVEPGRARERRGDRRAPGTHPE